VNNTSIVATGVIGPHSVAVDTPQGLRLGLQISLNSTNVLSVSANETNLVNNVENVTTANNWPYPDTGTLPCGNYDQFPIQYAVLQGYYDLSNYTSSTALTLYNTGVVVLCPTMSAPLHSLFFAPLSDDVSFYSPNNQDGFVVSANYSPVSGYWTGSQTTAWFHLFPQGVYTVLAEDEWGNVVLLHFTESDSFRSGPISTFPAAWGVYSSCPGSNTQGNTTTLSNLPTTYPNSWNTTTIVTLDQIYNTIVNSSAFTLTASGHGWVVYSWAFVQSGPYIFPPSDGIAGYFILTNSTSPDAYVSVFYDIQGGGVTVSALTTTLTVECPVFPPSSTTTAYS
jgi:hypothetical protein